MFGKSLPTESGESLLASITRNVSALKDVRCLDQLIRAHTLLAVMSHGTSHDHQLHLLTAYTLVVRMWQVPHRHRSDGEDEALQMKRLRNELSVTAGFHGNGLSDLQ